MPVVQVQLPGMQELFFEHAGDVHYERFLPSERFTYEEADAQIGIKAPSNTRALANVDPAKQQALAELNKPLSEIMLEKNRWMLTLFPTEALAQEADMGLAAYEEFAFEAMGLNEDDPVRYWSEKSAEQERLKERLEEAREIRIVGPGTDLTLSVEGRTFVNSAGRRNMPCGEVFTGPIETSANGTVYFGVPAAIGGREVSGARLRFEDGKVVEASAEKGEEYLMSLLDTDAGARYLGELGIGTNYGIQQGERQRALRREARRHRAPRDRPLLHGDRRQERLQRTHGPRLRLARGRRALRRRRVDPEGRPLPRVRPRGGERCRVRRCCASAT